MERRDTICSAQFIDSYFPVVDGVVQTVHHYAMGMNAFVVCPRMESGFGERKFPYEVLTGATVRFPFGEHACAVPQMDGRLRREIRRRAPDVLHAHSPALLGRYALSMGRELDIPVIASFHSKYYDALLEFGMNKKLAEAVTNGIVRFYESCDDVWACSEQTAEVLRSYGYRGKAFVMTNGTGFERPQNADLLAEKASNRFGIPREKHILLFVGQMVWYKNQKLISDAFRLLCDKSDDYRVVFVGDGRDREEIENYAGKLGLRDRVIFTGRIDDGDTLAGIYACADLLFFPSVYDNTPLVVREAAVMGVPSLLTAGSTAAEPITDGVNGFTAEETPEAMRRRIEQIFADKSNLTCAGEAARRTITARWEDLIPQIEARYREVLERRRFTQQRIA